MIKIDDIKKWDVLPDDLTDYKIVWDTALDPTCDDYTVVLSMARKGDNIYLVEEKIIKEDESVELEKNNGWIEIGSHYANLYTGKIVEKSDE